MLKISSISTIFVKVPIVSTKSGVVDDPTSDTVKFAFMEEEPDPSNDASKPTSGDWVTGSWETSRRGFFARCLVGPDGGATTLAPREDPYWIWVWIADAPEQPKEPVGAVQVI